MTRAKWHVFPLTAAPFLRHPVEYNKNIQTKKYNSKSLDTCERWRSVVKCYESQSISQMSLKTFTSTRLTHYSTRQLRSGRSLQVPSVGSRTSAIQPPSFFTSTGMPPVSTDSAHATIFGHPNYATGKNERDYQDSPIGRKMQLLPTMQVQFQVGD